VQDRHRDRNHAGLESKRKLNMAIIGNFTKKNNRYTGSLRTISLALAVDFAPIASTEKGPDFRVVSGSIELGAAWKKSRKDGSNYLSVRLDDPTFLEPIFANLIEGSDGQHALIWSRRVA
jgi:uncharacterized protein (DUF736 family)